MDLQIHKFANIATVIAKETEDQNRFVVYWKSGVNRQGKVLVHIPIQIEDKRCVAELTAMQHIIEELDVIGSEPPLKGLKLTFSVPAIKKVHLNKSEKRHLYPYAYFLTARFMAAAVDHSQDDSWIKPRADQYVSELQIEEPPGEWVHVNKIGKVSITRHVIEKFAMRMNNIEPVEAWRALTKILSQARLEQVEVAEDRKVIDRERHFSEGIRLIDTLTKWCFVIATNKAGKQTIATAYLRL